MQSILAQRHLAAQATPPKPQRHSSVRQHGRAFPRLPHQLPKASPAGLCRAGPGTDPTHGTPADPWGTSYERAAIGEQEVQAEAADQQEAAYNVQAYPQQYAQQQGPPRPEYYMAVPPTYPVPNYAPPPAAASSGIPWWVWMGAGILVANVARLVQDVMKKGPQQMMMEMAMKQMMKGASGGAPGGSPFGGMPGGMPGGGMPGSPPFPYGNQNPFAPGFNASAMGGSPATSTVDTTATDVLGSKQAAAAASAPASGSDTSRGEKFNARVGSDGRSSSPSNGGTQNGAKTDGVDVVEAEVKEPSNKASSSSSSSSTSSGAQSSSSFFTDVGAGSTNGNGGSSGASGASSSAGASTADTSQMTAMMEQMLRDPSMQKMLYPYLPEPMRNPESIEWMLNNPEVRKQMEQVFASQGMGMNPQMMEMMKQMDFSQEKVQAQFSELGLKPEDVINKVLATPDLAAGFSNPKVQQAIFDISQNPMNITKYQEDPEVMKVLEKVTELFGPSMGGAGGMAGMGGIGGMGGMGGASQN